MESLLNFDCKISATSTHDPSTFDFHHDKVSWFQYQADFFTFDLKYIILATQPDIIINAIAAGLTTSQDYPNVADQLNNLLNREIIDCIKDTDIRYFLLSTSYVFDSIADAPDETVMPECNSVYGMTKLAGEQIACELDDRCHIIRVTTVWGKKMLDFQHDNLLLDVHDPVKQQSMTVFDNIYRTPTIVSQVAEAIADYIFSLDLKPVIHITHNQIAPIATWIKYLPREITDQLTFGSYTGEIMPEKSGLSTIYPNYSKKLDTVSFLQNFTLTKGK